MDCQTFRKKHDAFVDDTLPGVQMAAMREHLNECARCARRDAEIRRAILLVRNLQPLTVSDGFDERLKARLHQEAAVGPTQRRTRVARQMRFATAAAIVALFATAAGRQLGSDVIAVPVLSPAVVTTAPPDPGEDPSPAFVASMSTGIPMWPALMLAEEGPLLFAASELQAGYSREP
jgi:anti-sigma factor RsiW